MDGILHISMSARLFERLIFLEATSDAVFAIAITMAELWHPSYCSGSKDRTIQTFFAKPVRRLCAQRQAGSSATQSASDDFAL
jgi:hypothetical protein